MATRKQILDLVVSRGSVTVRGTGQSVPPTFDEEQAARALMTHDDLIAACKTALHCLSEGDRTTYDHPESPYYFLHEAIRKATRKATR